MQKSKFNFQKLSQKLLKVLPQKSKEVIARRYGISTGRNETLQEIGESFGITRERVRQIENWGFKILKGSFEFKKLEPVFQSLEEYLNFFGGLKREDVLFYNLAPESQHSALNLVLKLSSGFERVPEGSKFFTFWSVGKNPQNAAIRVVDFLVESFKKCGSPMEEGGLQKIYQKEIPGVLKKKISKDAFFSYLEISKEIKKGAFGKIGLFFWPEINPKGVRDEAYLSLKKESKPLHFSGLTTLINKDFHQKNKPAQVQTVHNELIKDLRFVLIGRGVYALKEWGYEPGVVKDVIVKVLKENKKPLTKEQIVDKVLKCRAVKKNTVLFNLQDKNYFKKMTDGKYQIA
ncbi:MAG: hypothetical protein COV69_00785 [Parcubacteria group bacterium CG11_big_fil_rev_8_21_14_0_20_39_14]|nr:MAG: hypothetical protein COV69_00785 [Parcubacteria group bacterium CG11_big_fil_rev_8_21_14_0_20_39_14]PIS35737.1 MAG: hypothetical protein COT36_00720 [Parcubacteria group bacterium CG08_land_8_20_14_0_20_38_56]